MENKARNSLFTEKSDPLADLFNTSLPVDKQLYREDITASVAHAKMLGETGIIAKADAKGIVEKLGELLKDIESGKVTIEKDEDIHMFVEGKLGDAGKRMHTARSRNDQVVTDFRLYTRGSCETVVKALKNMIDTLIGIAKKHTATIMPGFTHMQKAQPVTLAHHLMAYAEMFYRDILRFREVRERVNVCPLGSGALAGTAYPIDRKMVAKELDFSDITYNSLDAVSDRDFVLDYLYATTTTFIHLSRFAEEVITWASNEYRFIVIADAYCTGSSMMPQKKNPDMAELARGKSGKILGNFVAMATILKGLPLSYNKDLQEDKALLFESEDSLLNTLEVFRRMLSTAKFNADVMLQSAKNGFMAATDIADYLVKKGVAFRDTHEISGALTSYAIKNGKVFETLSLEEFKKFSPLFEKDIFEVIKLENLVNARKLPGGTAEVAVKANIENLCARLAKV